MTEQARSEDRVPRPEPLPNFYGQDRHEMVQNLAYQHWEKEALRWVHQKLIGWQPKRPCAPACWLQELSSGRMRIYILERRSFEL
jgi:hypothetical protein